MRNDETEVTEVETDTPETVDYSMVDPKAEAMIENSFRYHPPFGDQEKRYAELRNDFKALARKINRLSPPSAERTLSFRKLEQAQFYANASIARNETQE